MSRGSRNTAMLHHCIISFHRHRRPRRRCNRRTTTGHIGRIRFHFRVARDSSSQMGNVSSHHLPRTRSTIAAAAAAIQQRHIVRIRVRSTGATVNFHGRLLSSITCPSSPPGETDEACRSRSAHLHVSCADKTNFKPPDEIRRTGREFVIQ